ncbi:hypothetical protein BACUNI_02338 [Bacteroides uniformis ATCC 8492]|uniref:Uncharacterized protein n=1 Tax=Bacteroides uniformis (strain ATCC 8492 / DSM 6597 / CCUG 4942 / CIP 103695 / JCM 5828 / KCTC 5204 / NCTC 13054 / VPI 0061) TaxID=411479 RepID=A0ABC9NAG3_BACUC|nr:hypothetical protein BACUNI_02338 [Bacteroides uniformis ATCC 8492]
MICQCICNDLCCPLYTTRTRFRYIKKGEYSKFRYSPSFIHLICTI